MERTDRTRPRRQLRTESIRTWQAAMDRLGRGEGSLYHDASNAEEREIVREVKLFLANGHYVEGRPFRKVPIRDGKAVDLEVPAFLTGRSR